MIILERVDSVNEEGNVFTKKMAHSSQIIKSGESPTSPLIRWPQSAPSPLGAKNTINRSRENIFLTSCQIQQDHISRQQPLISVSKSAEGHDAAVQSWQAPNFAEGMLTKSPHTNVLAIQKRGPDQQEAQISSRLNSVQGSKQSLELNETWKGKEFNAITIYDRGNVLERNGVKDLMHQYNHKSRHLRPPSLQRNTSTLDSKVEVRNVQQISTVTLPSVDDHLPKQFSNQQIFIPKSPRLLRSSDQVSMSPPECFRDQQSTVPVRLPGEC